MSSRSLNKVMLIGNLTRDVELRYTPSGTAVATFGLATNRSWSTDSGERQEDTQFHRVVAWSKLAEICGQLLFKGRKIYVEGRLQTRKFTGQDGAQREITEIVAETMMILDNRTREGGIAQTDEEMPGQGSEVVVSDQGPSTADKPARRSRKVEAVKSESADEAPMSNEVNIEDIPF